MTGKPITGMQAFLAAQSEFPKIRKSKTARGGSYSWSYADLGDMLEQLGPVLHKHGIAYTFPCVTENGSTRLGCKLIHAASGEVVAEAYLPLAVPDNPRELGSKKTYYRRYLFADVNGVHAEEDDDGGAASAGSAKRRSSGSPASVGASEPQAGAAALPTALERLQKATTHFKVNVFGGNQEAADELFRRRFGTAEVEAIGSTYSADEVHGWLDKKALSEAEELAAEFAEKEAGDVF